MDCLCRTVFKCWWWRNLCGCPVTNGEIPTAVYPEGIRYPHNSRNFQPQTLVTLDPGALPGAAAVLVQPFPEQLGRSISTVPTITSISENESDVRANDWFEHDTRQNFPRGQVIYDHEVGRGWFGKVIEANVSNIPPFMVFQTVKAIVQVQRDDSGDREQMKFLHDARFYRDMSHENILRLLGYCIERSPYMLIYEKWPLGDLKAYLFSNGEHAGEAMYQQGILTRMAVDIAKALEYMGEAGYAHGDLAARNCLVANTNGKVILGDYGLAPQKYKEDYYMSGRCAWPIRWAAPESLHCTLGSIKANKITLMANVWTFGIVLWEIFEFGRLPYPELTNELVLEQVVTFQTYILEPPTTPFLTEETKDIIHNIMLSCWNIDPGNRPGFSQILKVLGQL